MEKLIEVALLDKDGYNLGGSEFDSVKEAKRYAKLMLKSKEDIAQGLFKAEVRVNLECIADYFA